MSDRYQGPDGTVYEFPAGTSRDTALNYMAEQERRKKSSGATVARTIAARPQKRGALERLSDNFKDTLLEMPAISEFRAGFTGGGQFRPGSPMSVVNQAADTTDRIVALIDAATGRTRAPAAPAKSGVLGGLATAALSISADPRSVMQAQGRAAGAIAEAGTPGARKAAADAEKARRAEFDRISAEDPWYKAEGGLPGKALHGASALTGVLLGSATDPTSYVTGGRSILQRSLVQSGVAAAGDLSAQESDASVGIINTIDYQRVALSAAAGFAFTGGLELAAKGPKGFMRDFFRDTEADLGPVLQEADDIMAPTLSALELPDLRMPMDEQLDLFDIPDAGPQVSDFAEEAGGALAVRSNVVAGAGPEARADGPEVEPEAPRFDDTDWGTVRSETRRAAARKHLATLEKAIKPEARKAFLAQLNEGVSKSMPNGSPRVSHINPKYVDWSKIDAEPELLLSWVKAREDIFSDVYSAAKVKERVSFDQIAATAKLFGSNVSDIARAHANITGEGGISASIVAIKEAALESDAAFMTMIDELTIKLNAGTLTDNDKAAFASAVERTVMLDAMAKASTSEVARSLAVMKRMARPRGLNDDIMADLADSLNRGKKMEPEDLANIMRDLKKAYGKGGSALMRDRLRLTREWSAWDYAGYMANAALLSAPKTFIRNFVGPVMHSAMLVADRYTAAGIGAARGVVGYGSVERVTFREANAYATAYAENLMEAIAAGSRAFMAGVPTTEGGSQFHPDAIPFIPYAMTPERAAKWKASGLTMSSALDRVMVGMYATARGLAYRPMLFADEAFKYLGRNAELSALAHREAAYRAKLAKPADAEKVYLRTLDAIRQEPTADAAKAARAYFAKSDTDPDQVFDPGSRAEEMALALRSIDIRDMAIEHARMLTFQNSGLIARDLDRALRAMPLIKYGFVNFVRTPLAIFRSASVDRNPVLALIAKDNREKLGVLLKSAKDAEAALQRGGAEADDVLARLGTGMAVMSMAWMMYASGALTGPRGGYGDAEQSDGVLPFSMKMPTGDWVQLTTLSPLAEPFRLVASVAELMRHHDFDDEQADSLVGVLLVALADSTLASTSLASVQSLFKAMGQGGAPGQDVENRTEMAGKEVRKALAARVIPFSSALRSVAQEFDPVRRETDNWIESFRAMVPLLSRTLPARRDFLGRTELIPEGQRGPFEAFPRSERTSDPLMLELSRLAVALPADPRAPDTFGIRKPPRKFNGEDLTYEEYGRLLEAQGQIARHPETGMNMEDTLRALVQAPGYAALPDPAKAKLIKDTVTTMREIGKKEVMDPRSPAYMGEMVRRTGVARFRADSVKNQWSPDKAAKKARSYGLTPDDMGALQEALTPN